jgi:hypothetical protein
VAALNHAIRGLPQERIRFHLCWGSWHGPHTTDIPLRDIVEVLLAINAHAYSFEAGNVRHEHEWKVWQEVKLPDDKLILPGVVSHATNVVEHPELVADRIVRFANMSAESGLSPRQTAVSAVAFIRKSPGPSLKRWHKAQHWPAANCGTDPVIASSPRPAVADGGVGFCQSGERAPRHDRSEDSPICPNAGLDGCDNFIPAPGPQPCFVVRREVRIDECARTQQVETDVGAAQKVK